MTQVFTTLKIVLTETKAATPVSTGVEMEQNNS